uniref:Uncharacterized protein n=1 Tax=Anopheles farauti TaxID=69004 RepID=A0A182QEX8_9DIPT
MIQSKRKLDFLCCALNVRFCPGMNTYTAAIGVSIGARLAMPKHGCGGDSAISYSAGQGLAGGGKWHHVAKPTSLDVKWLSDVRESVLPCVAPYDLMYGGEMNGHRGWVNKLQGHAPKSLAPVVINSATAFSCAQYSATRFLYSADTGRLQVSGEGAIVVVVMAVVVVVVGAVVVVVVAVVVVVVVGVVVVVVVGVVVVVVVVGVVVVVVVVGVVVVVVDATVGVVSDGSNSVLENIKHSIRKWPPEHKHHPVSVGFWL